MIAIIRCRAPCRQACRSFSVNSALWSGHNRWSKIKHDKAKEDASTTKQRSAIAHDLTLASREYGPDPQNNTRLAAIVVAAKKLGFPKTSIENAIARGQGVSPNGTALEALTVEVMLPSSVAAIIECQTDSRLRTLADMRLLVKNAGGMVSPTNHLFERKGRILLENSRGFGEEDIFDQAIEAGATDIEVGDDGTIELLTEPNQTVAAAKSLASTLDVEVRSADIVWSPKEDMKVTADNTQILTDFLDRVYQDPSVQDVYTNAL